MAELGVVPLGNGHFRVTVAEGGSTTTHDVAVPAATMARLGWTKTPEELLRGSFQFMLRRESKESILSRFDVSVIARYFPEFEREIARPAG